jgi:hypothetical protein
MARPSDSVIFNQSLDRSEEILEILSDSFGEESPQFTHVMERYNELVRAGTPGAAKLAMAYLEWCYAHPRRIANFQAVKHCTCDNGMVLLKTETESYRPCERCLPATFDKWSGVTLNDDEEEDLGF